MAETPEKAERRFLSLRSRYRNTPLVSQPQVRTDEGRSTFFEVWRPPEIIETKPPIRHRVRPEEINRMGLLAFRFYGDKTLWWAIALRNNLLLPFTELEEGQLILIPQFDDVIRALQTSTVT